MWSWGGAAWGGGWSAGISVLLLVVKLAHSLLSLSYYLSCRLMMMQVRTDQKVPVPIEHLRHLLNHPPHSFTWEHAFLPFSSWIMRACLSATFLLNYDSNSRIRSMYLWACAGIHRLQGTSPYKYAWVSLTSSSLILWGKQAFRKLCFPGCRQ